MSRFNRFLLPLLSGILLFFAWPMSPLTLLIFVAWIPLLLIEDNSDKPYRFFYALLLNLFIWNVATTWWIWNASEGGAVGAIVANSMLMTIPWMLFRLVKQKLGRNTGYVALVVFWVAFEYIHHNWDLSWPWLTLGNVFATHPGLVLWYRYTGTTGGTIWVWVINILLFRAVRYWQKEVKTMEFATPGVKIQIQKKRLMMWMPVAVILLFPIFVSMFLRSPSNQDTLAARNRPNVVVVQPNIDPYKEKFSGDVGMQVDRLISLSEAKIDTNTRLVVWPETAIPTQAWEDQIKLNPFYQPVFAFVKRHPAMLLVTGIDSYQNHGNENSGGFSIRHDQRSGIYYEAFNTALAVDTSLQLQLYHKSKLVPGVESLPSWLGFMGKLFEGLGGISGTLGRNKEPVVFGGPNNPYRPAPVICYESIYGAYVTEYLRKGANIITIITNDGWWGNTPGYHQHQSYARLRAIESGCWIARSANTGISCFISPEGEVLDAQPWDTEASIKREIPVAAAAGFYARHGDWISPAAIMLTVLLLLATATRRWWKKSAEIGLIDQ